MKRYFIYVMLLAAFAFTLVSCQKQLVKEEDEIIITDTVPVPKPIADPVYPSTGVVVGKIMPETKFTLHLYNDYFSYSEYTIVNRTGAFLLKDVKPGEYTLLVQPHDQTLNSVELIKIAVDSGRTTNLGLIFLP